MKKRHYFHILSIIGARPQFIKVLPLCKTITQYSGIKHSLIHTGQHYDFEMSEVFFNELLLPSPDYYLGIGSGSHGYQTGEILKGVEEILLKEKPNCVLVFGDTNSTLAGALASVKLNIPLVHVEAGLRSFKRKMPEEINRRLTDQISDVLFCPTQTAVDNLKKEGFFNIIEFTHINKFKNISFPIVLNVGDIMYEALLMCMKIAERKSNILERLNLKSGYFLVTIHRAENTDDIDRFIKLIRALKEIGKYKTVVFPVHPRTRKVISGLNIKLPQEIKLIEPVSYLDMLVLEKHSYKILTDSGGVQKEAYLMGVPCVTLRDETEWVETISHGWNRIVGIDVKNIVKAAFDEFDICKWDCSVFGDGKTSYKIIETLYKILKA